MTLELEDWELDRLRRIMNLPGESFDRLIELSTTHAENRASRVQRLTSDHVLALFERTIKKFSLGQDIWWEVAPGTMQGQRPGPNKQMVPYTQPMLSLIMGMRGALLGPQYDVWFIVACDPKPDEKQIERAVTMSMEELSKQKASQLNGGPLKHPGIIQGRPIKDNPQA